MRRSHDEAVEAQFDPQAQAYLHSAVHADGPDLAYARAQIAAAFLRRDADALDVGCGAGHLSFAMAPSCRRVVALDPSPRMLATVEGAAAARGVTQIETHQGHATALPFADAAFDLVGTRYSAHHWVALGDGLIEMRRVLRPGGRLLVIDVLGAEDALVDTHLQAIELLRDPSHVRDRSASEWRRLLDAARFVVDDERHWPLRIDFAAWIARMRTPDLHVAAIRALQRLAAAEVRAALVYEDDGSFTCETGAFWARRRD